MTKRILSVLISAMVLYALCVSSPIFAQNDAHKKIIAVTKVYDRIGVHIIDDEHYNLNEDSYDRIFFAEDSEPFIDENDRTQIPIRAIAETLNFHVNWDGLTQEITITKGQDLVILNLNSNQISVNGTISQMDTYPILKNDRTFIPLRYIGEALGYEVDYSEATELN